PRPAPPPCPDRRCRSGAGSGGLPLAEPVERRVHEDARRFRHRRALMLLADTLLADPAQSPAAVAAGAPLSTGQTPAGHRCSSICAAKSSGNARIIPSVGIGAT